MRKIWEIKNQKSMYKLKNKNSGITLIALVVTIIVLLILARNKYINANWAKWNIK